MPFRFSSLAPFADVLAIEVDVLPDDRGWFAETYKQSQFEAHGVPSVFVQDNHTFSQRSGTLRGLHYQTAPHEQGKLVRCTRGAVFDAIVDIRPRSATFGKWASKELSALNRTMMWIPAGFAHGIATLVDQTEVQYKTTAEYSAPHERAIRWDDPAIGIRWPVNAPILSTKDKTAPLLKQAVAGTGGT